MNLNLDNVNIIDNMRDLIKYFKKKKKLYKNKNSFNTFFNNCNDYIIINNKNNSILYIYRNIPKYKYIKVDEDIKNTSILVIPQNTSIGFKIGDVLTINTR